MYAEHQINSVHTLKVPKKTSNLNTFSAAEALGLSGIRGQNALKHCGNSHAAPLFSSQTHISAICK